MKIIVEYVAVNSELIKVSGVINFKLMVINKLLIF